MKGNEMQTPEQPEWYTYILVLLVSMFGGFVRWLNKIRQSQAITWWAIADLIIGLITSGFAGFLTYLLCTSLNISLELTTFFIGNAGFMGILALEYFQEPLKKLAKHWKP